MIGQISGMNCGDVARMDLFLGCQVEQLGTDRGKIGGEQRRHLCHRQTFDVLPSSAAKRSALLYSSRQHGRRAKGALSPCSCVALLKARIFTRFSAPLIDLSASSLQKATFFRGTRNDLVLPRKDPVQIRSFSPDSMDRCGRFRLALSQ